MTDSNSTGLKRIKRALISVSDKAGIVDFAKQLKELGVEIISTGGTAKTLRDAGIGVRDVSDVTGFPEMMDGRVKTLHPKIHGGLLGVRDNPDHIAAMQQHGIEPIDMVVINLYPFEETIKRENVTLDEAIEQIDIGGPSMIRSAAKNYRDVLVVTAPCDYEEVSNQLNQNEGATVFSVRQRFAARAFWRTAGYDGQIFKFLAKRDSPDTLFGPAGRMEVIAGDETRFREELAPVLLRIGELRYGENPHQSAALYRASWRGGIAQAELLNGKEMSFNNYVD